MLWTLIGVTCGSVFATILRDRLNTLLLFLILSGMMVIHWIISFAVIANYDVEILTPLYKWTVQSSSRSCERFFYSVV